MGLFNHHIPRKVLILKIVIVLIFRGIIILCDLRLTLVFRIRNMNRKELIILLNVYHVIHIGKSHHLIIRKLLIWLIRYYESELRSYALSWFYGDVTTQGISNAFADIEAQSTSLSVKFPIFHDLGKVFE